MKKILTIILMLFLSFNISYAANSQINKINFNGNKYYLQYSAKNPEFNGYLNEYYKRGETYNLWSEMVAIHHFPNAYSPLDRVKQFRAYLAGINCPSALTFNDKKNIAMIDFLLIHHANSRTLLEFNIFKYEKSKKCGSNAIQYARRYVASNAFEVEQVKRDFEKNRKKLINNVKNMTVPAIIEEPIDLCKVDKEVKNESDKAEEIIEAKNTVIDDIKTKETNTISDENPQEEKEIASETKENEPKSEMQLEEKSVEEKTDIDDENKMIKNATSTIVENSSEIKEDIDENNEKIETVSEQKIILKEEDNKPKELPKDNKEQVKNDSKIIENSVSDTKKQSQKVKKKKKNKKSEIYKVVNDKNLYYKSTKPRKVTKKDIKKRAKETSKKLKDSL